MERGVIVGGLLVSASFLLAVILNRSAVEESASLAAPPASHPEAGALTPAALMQLAQPELDALYAAATAGQIPEGTYTAAPFVPRPRATTDIAAELIARLPDHASHLPVSQVRALAATLWRTRVFDGREQLKFPARVHCGPSLLRSDGSAILIDYPAGGVAGSHDVPDGDVPDGLTVPAGLSLREELRELRPGLYLGRAYSGNALVLNFLLYDEMTLDHETTLGAQPSADARARDDCSAARTAHR